MFIEIGNHARQILLNIADFIVLEWVPGLISIVLLAFTALLIAFFTYRTIRRSRAIAWARAHIETADSREVFSSKFLAIDEALSEPAKTGVVSFRRAISVAWMEYRETILTDPDVTVVRNSVRPGSFIESEDIGFGAGFWRIWPGMLVSTGLLLTFLGLIAALGAISEGELTDESLKQLLTAASAKFIMSLTGLFCSIILTIVLRIGAERIEDRLRELNHAIEKRLRFESMEDIALRHLRVSEGQAEAFKGIATELVAELARPLREELPLAIGASIRTEMAPLLERIQQDNSAGVGDMIGQITERLSGDVGQALAAGAARLGEAAELLARTAERLEGGGGRMGLQMEAGAERLLTTMNEVLDGIRENTGAGADAIRSAADEMRKAADGFRAAIDKASAEGAEIAGAELKKAADAARERIGSAAGELSDPLTALAVRLEAAAVATQDSAGTMERMSARVHAGGEAIERGAGRMEAAGETTARAAAPLATGVGELRRATDGLASAMEVTLKGVLESNRETAQRTLDALRVASETLGEGHAGTKATLEAVNTALSELTRQTARIDDIDAKLGQAMQAYRTSVETTMEGTSKRVDDIVQALGPALSTMQAVVQQAESFMPASPRPNGGTRS